MSWEKEEMAAALMGILLEWDGDWLMARNASVKNYDGEPSVMVEFGPNGWQSYHPPSTWGADRDYVIALLERLWRERFPLAMNIKGKYGHWTG